MTMHEPAEGQVAPADDDLDLGLQEPPRRRGHRAARKRRGRGAARCSTRPGSSRWSIRKDAPRVEASHISARSSMVVPSELYAW